LAKGLATKSEIMPLLITITGGMLTDTIDATFQSSRSTDVGKEKFHAMKCKDPNKMAPTLELSHTILPGLRPSLH
jgi:hypothetical protein